MTNSTEMTRKMYTIDTWCLAFLLLHAARKTITAAREREAKESALENFWQLEIQSISETT